MEIILLIAGMLVAWKVLKWLGSSKKVSRIPEIVEYLSDEPSSMGVAFDGVKFPVVMAYAEENASYVIKKERNRIVFNLDVNTDSYDVDVRRAGNGTNDALFVVKSFLHTGFKDFLVRANNGDADAQFKIGDLYQWGSHYMGKNKYLKAEHWYNKAARQGHAEAQNRLGVLYSGYRPQDMDTREPYSGISINKEEAIYWYTKSAEQGFVCAQKNLSNNLKDEGRLEEARKWLTLAAESGDEYAQNSLAELLEHEFEDLESALFWYKKALDNGHSWAKHSVEKLS